jgi:hypothetical protein
MTAETRELELTRFVDELSSTLSAADLSFTLGVLESIAMSIVSVWDALATPEPGLLDLAFKGMVV